MAKGRMTRRQMLRGAAAGAGLAAVGGLAGGTPASALGGWSRGNGSFPHDPGWPHRPLRQPDSRPDPRKPEGTDLLPPIEHIIIYMQENHSYDNYFGQLGRGDGFRHNRLGQPLNSNPDVNGNPVRAFHKTVDCDTGPGVSQSWNASHISFDDGRMDGFIRGAPQAGIKAMGYWDGTDLPFYYGLAETFPICDRWFCSLLGQTFPNRRYLQAATSLGIVSTEVNEVLATPTAPNGLIWDRLNAHGITWNDYAIDLADILLFPTFYQSNSNHVKTYQNFLVDCASGTLPQVSIISPGGTTYSEENPNDIQLGEAYSSAIINAVMSSPLWPKTALFFTWDEHGGYYDHVPPPPAVAPDNIAPRITVPPDQPGGFDRYGMRVPGFVISPFARKNYVSHVVHDHTSILKFIETKWNLGALTFRDANADNMLDSLNLHHPAFLEPPALPAPALSGPGAQSSCEPQVPLPEQPLTPMPMGSPTGAGGAPSDREVEMRKLHEAVTGGRL